MSDQKLAARVDQARPEGDAPLILDGYWYAVNRADGHVYAFETVECRNCEADLLDPSRGLTPIEQGRTILVRGKRWNLAHPDVGQAYSHPGERVQLPPLPAYGCADYCATCATASGDWHAG